MKWDWSISSRRKLGKTIGALLLAVALMMSMPSTSMAFGKGDHGPDVYVIQGMLKSMGSYAGPINGKFDNMTVKGVKYFQKMHGLPVTGAVDSRTFQSITYAYGQVKFPSGAKAKSGAKGNYRIKGEGGGQGIGGGAGQGGGQGIGGGAGQGGGQGIG
ncbi:Putative peptidoglycan binding domain-containing protein, partial [Paenibacillus algorifonticola]